MKLNYVENRDGRRVIRWAHLCLFFVVAVLTCPIAAGLVSLLLRGDLRYALHGAITGLVIFVAAFTYSLAGPIKRLPNGA